MVKVVATKDELVTILQSNELVVVDFTASWCGPCRRMAPEFDRLAKEHTKMTFLKVDVDHFDAADEYEITGVPSFLFYKNNERVKTVVGADLNQLESTIIDLCK